jgi:tetratricopeptide (TPR) repeat protein
MEFFISRVRKFRIILWCILLVFPLCSVTARGEDVNFNHYYRFPLSIGLEYQTLTPLGSYNTDYNIYEASVNIRYPIPRFPVLQPFLQIGLMRFDSLDTLYPEKWDHTHWYGALGLGYTNRFVRNFELGAEFTAGISEAVFPKVSDTGKVGSTNLLFTASGKISLNPSYALSIDIRPSVKYLLSLSSLKTFDGFLFGLGFSLNYRFGEDPDSSRSIIRSIRFEKVSLPLAFSAMQSYYVKNPVGSVTLTNTEKNALTDVEISFFQAGYMDSPTVSETMPVLGEGESLEVPLLASFNQEVFTVEGITPLTGEIIVTYKSRGKAAEQRHSVSYDLYDKTAITWDDNRKVGAFITPADSALRNYSSFVRQALKEDTLDMYNQQIQCAVQMYSALTEIGCLYQVDPTSPFTQAQENTQLVDSVSLPRDTLKRITGDCDDLTVLFCSLLETVGIETGFVTVPGHIYAAFNTKAAGAKYRDISPDRSTTMVIDGEIWVPVEITLVGRGDFLEAWRRGSELWNAFEHDQSKRAFYRTRNAQAMYRPVGLKESDLGLQYGDEGNIVRGFKKDMNKIARIIINGYMNEASASGDKKSYNKLGIAYIKLGMLDEAERTFRAAAQIDRNYLTPQLNLANIAFLRENYSEALNIYESVAEILRSRGMENSRFHQQVLLNISKVYYQLEKYQQAQEFFMQARVIDPDSVQEYSYLGSVASSTGRASDIRTQAKDIIFVDEE